MGWGWRGNYRDLLRGGVGEREVTNGWVPHPIGKQKGRVFFFNKNLNITKIHKIYFHIYKSAFNYYYYYYIRLCKQVRRHQRHFPAGGLNLPKGTNPTRVRGYFTGLHTS